MSKWRTAWRNSKKIAGAGLTAYLASGNRKRKAPRSSNTEMAKLGRVFKQAKRVYGPRKQKFKVKTKKGEANDGHSAISAHYARIILNKAIHKHDVGKWTYMQSTQGFIKEASGRQATSWIGGIGMNSQLVTSTGAGFNSFQNHIGLQQLNPYLQNTGSTLLPSRNPYTDKFLIKGVEFDMEFTNQSNTSVTLDIYFFTNKTTSQADPFGIWQQAMLEEGGGLTIMTLPSAGKTNDGAHGYQRTYNPHASPLEHKTFKRLVKTLHKATFHLGPHAVEVFKANIAYNKLVHAHVVNKLLAESVQSMPNCGIYVLGIARGQPVNDETDGAVTMTYAATNIGFISRTRYTMHSISGNAGRVDISTAASAVPSVATLPNQRLLNVQGTEVPVTQVF